MKKFLLSIGICFIVLFGMNVVYASDYSDCVDKCKNLPSSDRNTCEKNCSKSLCKEQSKGNSQAYDECLKQIDGTGDTSWTNKIDDVQCTYTITCNDIPSIFPNALVSTDDGMKSVGLKKSVSEIQVSVLNSKISVLVDGTQPKSEAVNGGKMVASFCGYDYNGTDHAGIDVTSLVNDKKYAELVSKKDASCPYLSLIYDGTMYAERYNEEGYNQKFINIQGSKTSIYYNGSTTDGEKNNKFTCFYECSYNGDTETISVVKNLDSSFTLNARYFKSGAYSDKWYEKISDWKSYDDCSSKLYTYGNPGSLYVTSKSKSNDNSYGTCTKINASDYYGVKIDENVKDDYTAVCGILTKNAQDFIYRILDWIKYGALVLTVGLSIFDFFKAVASEEDDAFKKAFKRMTKRIIVVIILFILPALLEFILKLTKIQGVDSSNPLCTK